MISALEQRLANGPPLLLDGATGTELERRQVPSDLPLWSTHALLEAPDVVSAIHAEYAAAGAEIVTANTFRTQRRVLARAGLAARAPALTKLAVELARASGAAFVAGSAPTLEDCYRPDLVPPDPDLAREHADHAENLARAGADLILVETMNTIREARAAALAARSTGLPVCVSFACGPGARLLSGESLAQALEAVSASEPPAALLVNCLPPSSVAATLAILASASTPFGVYANLAAHSDDRSGPRDEDTTPEAFAENAAGWLRAGARIVGGCCGTTPATIRAIAERI